MAQPLETGPLTMMFLRNINIKHSKGSEEKYLMYERSLQSDVWRGRVKQAEEALVSLPRQ